MLETTKSCQCGWSDLFIYGSVGGRYKHSPMSSGLKGRWNGVIEVEASQSQLGRLWCDSADTTTVKA
jgi:hypothetical protein